MVSSFWCANNKKHKGITKYRAAWFHLWQELQHVQNLQHLCNISLKNCETAEIIAATAKISIGVFWRWGVESSSPIKALISIIEQRSESRPCLPKNCGFRIRYDCQKINSSPKIYILDQAFLSFFCAAF